MANTPEAGYFSVMVLKGSKWTARYVRPTDQKASTSKPPDWTISKEQIRGLPDQLNANDLLLLEYKVTYILGQRYGEWVYCRKKPLQP